MAWLIPVACADFWQSTIERAKWEQYDTGKRLLEMETIRELLQRFDETEQTRITVRYPGGDSGSAWAVEFRNRIVAYGIPSRYVELIPGSGGLDILHVSMVSQ
jgi:hypothetical protein